MIIHDAESQIEQYVKDEVTNLTALLDSFGNEQPDASIFAPPHLDISLGATDLSAVPDTTLMFRFENLDIYLDLDVKFTADMSWTLPLYSSANPADNGGLVTDIKVPGTNLELGVLFTVDLIITVEAEIELNGGLHIAADNVTLEIALFGDEVSGIDLYVQFMLLDNAKTRSTDITLANKVDTSSFL